jgi:hypothetical protein
MRTVSHAIAAAVLALGACATSTLNYPTPTRTIWLDQGWTSDQQEVFHRLDQGTQTFGIPYEWFVALEQPSTSSVETPLFADKAWLDRFGFIAGTSTLPVGFARSAAYRDPSSRPWVNPANGAKLTGVGLSCAACHTGRLTYQGTELLIDGGSALTDLVALNTALLGALHDTQASPARFTRFAARVLGAGAGIPAMAALRVQLIEALIRMDEVAALELITTTGGTTEGFGRLDALSRIGNQVFGIDMKEPLNYRPRSAPVHYPHIWTSPWFTWVQYNGSIMQPMVRNAGEAMGVGAQVNLTVPGPGLYGSTVRVDHLYWAERTLAGGSPLPAKAFTGLRAPAWPTALPPIDQTRAAKGAVLYVALCQGCHLPAINTEAFWRGPWWQKIEAGDDTYLDLPQIPVTEIGTDAAQAADMKKRTVRLNRSVALGTNAFAGALGALVDKVTTHWYDSQVPPVSASVQNAMNGGRPNNLRAALEYKARPLNGIWATPPYLHNGSVPNLYALLSPVPERPPQVFLGDREYDPVHVGYRGAAITGGFVLDTALPGNRNTGHAFTDEANAAGKIGRALSPDERLSLIEYLKTL